jgi:hypothetical protein
MVILEMGSHELFVTAGLTVTLLFSVSQVAMTTGTQLIFCIFLDC